MSDKYILKGKVPQQCDDLLEWAKAIEVSNRRVAQDKIGDVTISTVFLGLDHSFGEQGPPVLFETMILGGIHDDYQERYCTWESAETGHRKAVELVKGGKAF